MKLRISDGLTLGADFVTSTQAILAQKGKGKTHAATVQAEELLDAHQQIIVIDPTDAWFGLRSSPDGRSTGYPIAVFGGDHGDVQLESGGGAVLAEAIVRERFSAIVCTETLTKGEELRFIGDFLETLYRKNREALHLFIDESDLFAPQQPYGGEARTCGATDDIVRRGRKKGIGCTLITQRASVLNKNVLSQADMLVALGCSHPLDLDAIEKWVRKNADPKLAKAMMDSLPSLPRGVAWAWNPSQNLFKKIAIRQRHTFDSGATPKAGEKKREPKILAPVDIARLGQSMAEAVQRQKENDPKALKAEIARLKKALDLAVHEQLSKAAPAKAVDKPVLKDGQLFRIEKFIDRVDIAAAHWSEATERATASLRDPLDRAHSLHTKLVAMASELRESIKSTGQPVRVEPSKRVAPSPPGNWRDAIGDAVIAHGMPRQPSAIGGGLRRILIALAQRPNGLTNRQIGIRAGLSSRSGTFSTYISRARSEGWIEDTGDVRRITLLGIEALGHYDPLPTGEGLAAYWLRELGTSGAARILRVVIDAYPNEVDASTIGERAQISPRSGTYATYVSKLRGLELVVGRGPLRAAVELFG